MAYDKIVILERSGQPSDLNYRLLFRFDIPVARQSYYAKPGAVTLYKDEADATLNAKLVSGAVVEIEDSINLPAGTGDAAAGAAAVAKYNQRIALEVTTNPYIKFGTSWNGVSWTVRGVS